MAGVPPFPPGMDLSHLPPLPPGFDIDMSALPPLPPGFDFSRPPMPPAPPSGPPSRGPMYEAAMPTGRPPIPTIASGFSSDGPGFYGGPPVNVNRGPPLGMVPPPTAPTLMMPDSLLSHPDAVPTRDRRGGGRSAPPPPTMGVGYGGRPQQPYPVVGGGYPTPNDRDQSFFGGGPGSAYPPSAAAPGFFGAPTPGFAPPGAAAYSSVPQPSRGPPPSRSRSNTVWLGNVTEQTQPDEMIFDEFSKYGRILRVGRLSDKGVMFVHYATADEAAQAIGALTASMRLGPEVRINFGKNFDYTPEELQREWRPRRRDDDRYGERRHDDRQQRGFDDRRDEDRRSRREQEPTNVLWVGELPSSVPTDALRHAFQDFGKVLNINRPEAKNMAFVHFETIEQCRHAIDVMRGVAIAGHILKLNFGKPIGARDNEMYANEVPMNVVWLGQLPPEMTTNDLNELFDQYPGYINGKLLTDSHNGFGHFDTVEHASECRRALQGMELFGSRLKVGFGKNSHQLTMADRYDLKKDGAPGSFHLDPSTGMLVPVMTSTSLLPMEYGAQQAAAEADAFNSQPKWMTRVRPSPNITLDTRIASLITASYYSCGDADKPLLQQKVDEMIQVIDHCNAPEMMERLYDIVLLAASFSLPHCIAIVVKRLKQYHNHDMTIKGYCFYAIARIVFWQGTAMLSADPKLKPMLPSLDLFELLAYVCTQGADEASLEKIGAVLKGVCAKLLSQADPELVSALQRLYEKKQTAADFSKLLASIKKS